MIQSGEGWELLKRNVEKGGADITVPVAFFVFVPVADNRGGMTVQVVPLILQHGELVAAVGKLKRSMRGV